MFLGEIIPAPRYLAMQELISYLLDYIKHCHFLIGYMQRVARYCCAAIYKPIIPPLSYVETAYVGVGEKCIYILLNKGQIFLLLNNFSICFNVIS